MSKTLVSGETLLALLFPYEQDRPSLRTLARWKKCKIIPYVPIAGRIYFDPASVREALDKKNTVKAR